MKKLFFALCGLTATLSLVGCSGDGSGLLGDNNPRVRMVNAVPNTTTVDATITNGTNEVTALDNSNFGEVSTLAIVDNGNREFRFRDATSGTLLVEETVLCEINRTYTAVGFEVPGVGHDIVVVSDALTPAFGNSAMRVINATGSTAAVDVYVGPAAGTIAGATLWRDNIASGSASTFAELPLGNKRIYVTGANDQNVIVSREHMFEQYGTYTVIVANDGTGTKLLIIG